MRAEFDADAVLPARGIAAGAPNRAGPGDGRADEARRPARWRRTQRPTRRRLRDAAVLVAAHGIGIASLPRLLRRCAALADGGAPGGFERRPRDLARPSAGDPAPGARPRRVDRSTPESVPPKPGSAPPAVVRGRSEGLDIARLSVAAERVAPALAAEAAARLAPAGGDSINGIGPLA